MSAAVAHADPSFVIAESQARAGDAVHFSITGADGDVTYELEVADRDVLEGAGDGSVSGAFTMPDLGGSAKSVTVEADIREDDDKTTVKRKLQYLGPALPAAAPPEPQPAAASPAPQQAAPAPSQPSAAAEAPAASAPKAKQRAKRVQRRHRRTRRTAVRHRDTPSSTKQAKRDSPAKAKQRSRRKAARTAPLFDGVPEPGSSRYPVFDDEPKARQAKPLAALLAAANRSEDGEHATAILVPGLLGLAGFLLAGATLLRKRRTR